jgi:hypothetical protein
MAQPNQDPATIGFPMAQRVSFETTDLDFGNPFVEPHTVNVTNSGGATIIPITGNKAVVPLTNSTSAGANFLKLHYPQPGSSDFYVTFCTKTNGSADGYYDYTAGIPAAYRADLRSWILNGALVSFSSSVSITRQIVFTVYGLDTNVVSAAIQYAVKFTGTFGGGGTTTRTGPSTFTAS